jgi:hypothetical protein
LSLLIERPRSRKTGRPRPYAPGVQDEAKAFKLFPRAAPAAIWMLAGVNVLVIPNAMTIEGID